MSGLAEILLDEHFTVSGSDNKESSLTDHLVSMGAKVFIGQKASNIEDTVQVVVYTAAIHEDNEEYQEAVRRGLPMLSRAELLGQLMTNYKIPVAVAGTHGKTTTTSMLSHILLAGEKDPTISVGGILKPSTAISVSAAPRFLSQKPANIQTATITSSRRSVSS